MEMCLVKDMVILQGQYLFLYMCWFLLYLQTQEVQLQKGACVPVLFKKKFTSTSMKSRA